MANYTTSGEVKEELQIAPDEEHWDNEILSSIATAEGFIDSILSAHNISVPLTTVHQNVKDAAKNFAVYYFNDRRAAGEEPKKFYNKAMDFLNKYINQTSDEEIPFIVARDET